MASTGASGSDGKGQGVAKSVTYYRLEEVAKRNSSKEIWLVIHGRVYDITPFLNEVGSGVCGPGSCRPRAGRREGRPGCGTRPSGSGGRAAGSACIASRHRLLAPRVMAMCCPVPSTCWVLRLNERKAIAAPFCRKRN